MKFIDSKKIILGGGTIVKIQSYPAFQSDADATLVGDEAEGRAANVLIVTFNGVRLNSKTLPVDFFKCQNLI